MKVTKKFNAQVFFLGIIGIAFTQQPNGQIDDISELTTKFNVPFIMPDKVKLYADIYMPITKDCVMITIDSLPLIGKLNPPLKATVLPIGAQYIVYDSVIINGVKMPTSNPYKIPVIFTRTPYNKGDAQQVGAIAGLMGVAWILQDMRGRYQSEGVYLPMYSDSWRKDPYLYPGWKHPLDLTSTNDIHNGNYHEDGYWSYRWIMDALFRKYDLNQDGDSETIDKWFIPRIAMVGASALGNTQLQAAAAKKIDPSLPGLKSLTPIVATLEYHRSAGFHNGVFRHMLITGWLKGQFLDLDDDLMPVDTGINYLQNNIHTSKDYNLPNKFIVGEKAVDFWSSAKVKIRDGREMAIWYPNFPARGIMDGSFAPVDSNGESMWNGPFSRYTNLQVPTYHITGWWDIFIDGQLLTRDLQEKYAINDKIKSLQKIIVGPWAHQTIGTRSTGDMRFIDSAHDYRYPENVLDVMGKIYDQGDLDELQTFSFKDLLETETFAWPQYNLLYDSTEFYGEPKFELPQGRTWYNLGFWQILMPAYTYRTPRYKFLNFISGTGPLENFPIRIKSIWGSDDTVLIDLPPSGPLIPNIKPDTLGPYKPIDFTKIPPIRFYVIGPVKDGIPQNNNVGNYWFSATEFPLGNGVKDTILYLHAGGTLEWIPPTVDEGTRIYLYDPDDPPYTIGGNNMIVEIPQGGRKSQGQMNLADPNFAPYTMNRPDVLQYISPVLQDTLSIIGFPKFRIWCSSNPGEPGPTDTDFMIRILDVYPDGRELFVTEGVVNARAREYAKGIIKCMQYPYLPECHPDVKEDTTAPFSNIIANQIYEYYFMGLPIAYTFGKGHRIKILVSSANYPKYQPNPNIPVEDGDFFRRQPGDGTTYTYKGKTYSARKAIQRIYHSPQYPSQIILPFFTGNYILGVRENTSNATYDNFSSIEIFPNPAKDFVTISLPDANILSIEIYSYTGQRISKITSLSGSSITLNVSTLPEGFYLVKANSKYGKRTYTGKLIITTK